MKIFVISAHPDDEVLGCGGTLYKHKNSGDEIYWIIFTSIYQNQGFTKSKIIERTKEINKIKLFYGIKKIFHLNYPTTTLNSNTVISSIPKISKIFSKIQPEVIYTMNRSDAHSDHRFAFESVMACTKSFRHTYVKKILMYECLSETEFAPCLPENIFQPNYYVDISNYFKKKIIAMQIYKSEIGEHPFPRSLKNIEALSIFRGASVGVEYAEAFQLIKFIEK